MTFSLILPKISVSCAITTAKQYDLWASKWYRSLRVTLVAGIYQVTPGVICTSKIRARKEIEKLRNLKFEEISKTVAGIRGTWTPPRKYQNVLASTLRGLAE